MMNVALTTIEVRETTMLVKHALFSRGVQNTLNLVAMIVTAILCLNASLLIFFRIY